METEARFKRWTGLAGVAGALLFFCGDMLFYGHWGSGATFHQGMLSVLQQASRTRLFVGGAVHALWVPRGLAIKYSAVVGSVAPELIDSLRSYWQFAYNLAAAPAYLAAVLLLLLVLFGKTAYPRWTALANFGVLSLLAPLAERIPAPLGAVVVGGFTNLSIAFFFLVSVMSTWRARGCVSGSS